MSEETVEAMLRPYGWTCGPEFWERYYTDPFISQLVNAVEKIAHERDEFAETLGFYANPETYHAVMFLFDPPTGGFDEDFDEDHGHWLYDRPMPGKLARATLTEHEWTLGWVEQQ